MTERRPIKNFGHPDKPAVYRSPYYKTLFCCNVRGSSVEGYGVTMRKAYEHWARIFHGVAPNEPTPDWLHPANGGESA